MSAPTELSLLRQRELEARIVESLANIRFQDEALVDEFLERPDFVKLKPLVKAASASWRFRWRLAHCANAGLSVPWLLGH